MSEIFGVGPSITLEEKCGGVVRWAYDGVFGIPEHKVLQQLWLITEYSDGKPIARREEWRKVKTHRP